jgi:predicted enzyme related to lactoylglutathione lyase
MGSGGAALAPHLQGNRSEPGDDFVTVYVQVPDVAEAVQRVVALGAQVDMPAIEAGRVVIGVFRDPAGNRIGLVRA